METTNIDLRRVEYPFGKVQDKSREYEFPEKFIEAYKTGHIVPAERAERPD